MSLLRSTVLRKERSRRSLENSNSPELTLAWWILSVPDCQRICHFRSSMMNDAIKSTDRFLARNDVAIASNVVVEQALRCEYIHRTMRWILICIRISWLENIKWSFDVIYVACTGCFEIFRTNCRGITYERK